MGALDDALRQRAGQTSSTQGDRSALDKILGTTQTPTALPSQKTPTPISVDSKTPHVGVTQVLQEVPTASKKVFGKVWDFVKGFVASPARAPVTAYKANEGIATLIAYGGLKATGQDAKAEQLLRDFNKSSKSVKVPGLGEVKPVDNPLAAIGVGAEIGGYVAPGAGEAGSVIMHALTGGAQFGLISGGEALSQDNPTAGGVAKATAGGFAMGAVLGLVGKVLGKVFKRSPALPDAVENAGYAAPDIPIGKAEAKTGSSVLSPTVIKNFQKQAAAQVEHEAPGMGKIIEKTNLKGVTTIPEAETKMLKSLPKNAPDSARQAVRSWAKSELGMVGQKSALLPAEADQAAAKVSKPTARQTFTGYRSVGSEGKAGTGEQGVMYFSKDPEVAKAYNVKTGGKGVAETTISLDRNKVLNLSNYTDEKAYLLRAQKELGAKGADMSADARINWLAKKEGYDAVDRGAENGVAILNPKNVEPKALPATQAMSKKAESFATRVKKAADTNPDVAAKLDQTYGPITNKETVDAANKAITSDGIDMALSRARVTTTPTAQSNMEAQILIKKLMQKGRTDEAVDLVQHISKINREQGQAVQVLAAYSKLTPEGMLRFAQKTADEANSALAKSLKVTLDKLPATRKVVLTPAFAEKVTERMNIIDKMPDGLAKSVETAKVLRDVADLVPSSTGQKLATIQTIAQLINPKTIIRNVVGNTGFGVLENAITPIRVLTDKVTSLVTKERTANFGGFVQQFKSVPENVKLGYLESKYGINLDDLTTKMDLPQKRVFKKGVLGFFERALDWGLRLPDRVGYGMAAARKTAELESLVKAGKSKLDAKQIAELSDFYGKYATFQDLSPAAEGASKIKSGLNFGKSFGLGDIVLKYPKTPANLLARAVDYSPMGFLKTVFETARPVVGKLVKKDLPFRQAEFVDSFSRALAGTTSLVGTGAALAKVGILTKEKSNDKDVNAFRSMEGVGPYRFNVDGLWRYIKSGFNPNEAKLQRGDRLMSYDWFQPNAVMVSIGAHIADAKAKNQSIADTIVNSLASGVNTIAEQPLVTGIQRLFGNGDPIAGLVSTAVQTPASFIPTFWSQINQFLSNKQLETYSDKWWQEMYYSVASKIPVLANTVPQRVDVLGRDASRFQPGSNSIFNVFFNPAFMSVYQPTPLTKEIMRLYDQTGETSQIPSLISNKVTINGKDKVLNPSEYRTYQKFMGGWTTKLFVQQISSPKWAAMSDQDKVDWMQKTISNVRRAGKIKLFGDKPKSVSSDITSIVNQEVPKTPGVTGIRQLSPESQARAKNVVTFLKDYATALKDEPLKTISAIFGPERLRKISGDAVILERQTDLGALDLGDPNSQIDHIIPLALGGTNSWKNLQILTNKENNQKSVVETHLLKLLQSGKIKRKEAQKRALNWRKEYEDLQLKKAITQ